MGGVLGGKLPYILSDLKRSRKSNQMLSNTILMSTENVKFYQPGPTFPGSIRKSIYRGYIPKNLVPSVRAHEEPGPKCRKVLDKNRLDLMASRLRFRQSNRKREIETRCHLSR